MRKWIWISEEGHRYDLEEHAGTRSASNQRDSIGGLGWWEFGHEDVSFRAHEAGFTGLPSGDIAALSMWAAGGDLPSGAEEQGVPR